MKTFKAANLTTLALSACLLTFTIAPAQAHAQSDGAVIGAIIGGTGGAAIGSNTSSRGNNTNGAIAGAVIGGALGYIVGSGLDNDSYYRKRYANKPGTFFRYNGKQYRRYPDSQHGYVSIEISSFDPYYYSDGRRKKSSAVRRNSSKSYGNSSRRGRR